MSDAKLDRQLAFLDGLSVLETPGGDLSKFGFEANDARDSTRFFSMKDVKGEPITNALASSKDLKESDVLDAEVKKAFAEDSKLLFADPGAKQMDRRIRLLAEVLHAVKRHGSSQKNILEKKKESLKKSVSQAGASLSASSVSNIVCAVESNVTLLQFALEQKNEDLLHKVLDKFSQSLGKTPILSLRPSETMSSEIPKLIEPMLSFLHGTINSPRLASNSVEILFNAAMAFGSLPKLLALVQVLIKSKEVMDQDSMKLLQKLAKFQSERKTRLKLEGKEGSFPIFPETLMKHMGLPDVTADEKIWDNCRAKINTKMFSALIMSQCSRLASQYLVEDDTAKKKRTLPVTDNLIMDYDANELTFPEASSIKPGYKVGDKVKVTNGGHDGASQKSFTALKCNSTTGMLLKPPISGSSTIFIVDKTVPAERTVQSNTSHWSTELQRSTSLDLGKFRITTLRSAPPNNTVALYRDGVLRLAASNQPQPGTICIGRGQSNSSADFHVAHITAFKRSLSDEERIKVEAYLASLYGVKLDSSVKIPSEIAALNSNDDVVMKDPLCVDVSPECIHSLASLVDHSLVACTSESHNDEDEFVSIISTGISSLQLLRVHFKQIVASGLSREEIGVDSMILHKLFSNVRRIIRETPTKAAASAAEGTDMEKLVICGQKLIQEEALALLRDGLSVFTERIQEQLEYSANVSQYTTKAELEILKVIRERFAKFAVGYETFEEFESSSEGKFRSILSDFILQLTNTVVEHDIKELSGDPLVGIEETLELRSLSNLVRHMFARILHWQSEREGLDRQEKEAYRKPLEFRFNSQSSGNATTTLSNNQATIMNQEEKVLQIVRAASPYDLVNTRYVTTMVIDSISKGSEEGGEEKERSSCFVVGVVASSDSKVSSSENTIEDIGFGFNFITKEFVGGGGKSDQHMEDINILKKPAVGSMSDIKAGDNVTTTFTTSSKSIRLEVAINGILVGVASKRADIDTTWTFAIGLLGQQGITVEKALILDKMTVADAENMAGEYERIVSLIGDKLLRGSTKILNAYEKKVEEISRWRPPSKPETIDDLLKLANLTQLQDKFDEEGYDDLEYILSTTRDEYKEMCADVGVTDDQSEKLWNILSTIGDASDPKGRNLEHCIMLANNRLKQTSAVKVLIDVLVGLQSLNSHHLPLILKITPSLILLAKQVGKTLLALREVKPAIELDEKPVTRDLCAIEPSRCLVGRGVIGRNGELGINDENIVVNGVPRKRGIGMHAKKGCQAYAVFKIPSGLPRPLVVDGAVALNDTVKKLGSELEFLIFADGKQQWKSKPILNKGEIEKFRVPLPDKVREISLRVSCKGDDKDTKAVWVDPVICNAEPKATWLVGELFRLISHTAGRISASMVKSSPRSSEEASADKWLRASLFKSGLEDKKNTDSKGTDSANSEEEEESDFAFMKSVISNGETAAKLMAEVLAESGQARATKRVYRSIKPLVLEGMRALFIAAVKHTGLLPAVREAAKKGGLSSIDDKKNLPKQLGQILTCTSEVRRRYLRMKGQGLDVKNFHKQLMSRIEFILDFYPALKQASSVTEVARQKLEVKGAASALLPSRPSLSRTNSLTTTNKLKSKSKWHKAKTVLTLVRNTIRSMNTFKRMLKNESGSGSGDLILSSFNSDEIKVIHEVIDFACADEYEVDIKLGRLALNKQEERATTRICGLKHFSQLVLALKDTAHDEKVLEKNSASLSSVPASSFAPEDLKWDEKNGSDHIEVVEEGGNTVVRRQNSTKSCGHRCIRLRAGIDSGILTLEFTVNAPGCYGAVGVVTKDFNKWQDGKLGYEDQTWAYSLYPGSHNPGGGFNNRLQVGNRAMAGGTIVKIVLNMDDLVISYFENGNKTGEHKKLPSKLLFPCLTVGCSTRLTFNKKKCTYTGAGGQTTLVPPSLLSVSAVAGDFVNVAEEIRKFSSAEAAGLVTQTRHYLSDVHNVGPVLSTALETAYYHLISKMANMPKLDEAGKMALLELCNIDLKPNDLRCIVESKVLDRIAPMMALPCGDPPIMHELKTNKDLGTLNTLLSNGSAEWSTTTEGFRVRYAAWIVFRMVAYICAEHASTGGIATELPPLILENLQKQIICLLEARNCANSKKSSTSSTDIVTAGKKATKTSLAESVMNQAFGPAGLPTVMPQLRRNMSLLVADGRKFPWKPSKESKGLGKKGIVYFLGTNQGKAAQYSNPATGENKVISVAYSSQKSGALPHLSLDNYGKVITVAGVSGQKNTWVQYDFAPRCISVSDYSLKHYDRDGYFITDWVLEARARESDSWTVLSEHRNDKSFSAGSNCVNTWAIDSRFHKKPFTSFRVRMTGPNTTNTWHLGLSGFELYGSLYNSIADGLGTEAGAQFRWGTAEQEREWWEDVSHCAHVAEASVQWFQADVKLYKMQTPEIRRKYFPCRAELDIQLTQLLWVLVRMSKRSGIVEILSKNPSWVNTLLKLALPDLSGDEAMTGASFAVVFLSRRILMPILPSVAVSSSMIVPSGKELVERIMNSVAHSIMIHEVEILNLREKEEDKLLPTETAFDRRFGLVSGPGWEQLALYRSLLSGGEESLPKKLKKYGDSWRETSNQHLLDCLLPLKEQPAQFFDNIEQNFLKIWRLLSALCLLGGEEEPLHEGSSVAIEQNGREETGIIVRVVTKLEAKFKNIDVDLGKNDGGDIAFCDVLVDEAVTRVTKLDSLRILQAPVPYHRLTEPTKILILILEFLTSSSSCDNEKNKDNDTKGDSKNSSGGNKSAKRLIPRVRRMCLKVLQGMLNRPVLCSRAVKEQEAIRLLLSRSLEVIPEFADGMGISIENLQSRALAIDRFAKGSPADILDSQNAEDAAKKVSKKKKSGGSSDSLYFAPTKRDAFKVIGVKYGINTNEFQDFKKSDDLSFEEAEIVHMSYFQTHMAMLSADGKVFMYGTGSYGCLGTGHQQAINTPKQIKGLIEWKQIKSIATGTYHTICCTESEVFGWGFNSNGQLGDGSNQNTFNPKQLKHANYEGQTFRFVAAGYYNSFVQCESGALFGMGYGYYGCVGEGTSNKTSPTKIKGCPQDGFVQVAQSNYMAGGVTADGKLYTWGNNPYHGHKNPNTKLHKPKLLKVRSEEDDVIIQIKCTQQTTYVLSDKGKMYSWGYNYCGSLGHSNTASIYQPKPILQKDLCFVDFACAYYHCAAITKEGKLYTWGYGNVAMGRKNTTHKYCPTPVTVKYPSSIAALEMMDNLMVVVEGEQRELDGVRQWAKRGSSGGRFYPSACFLSAKKDPMSSFGLIKVCLDHKNTIIRYMPSGPPDSNSSSSQGGAPDGKAFYVFSKPVKGTQKFIIEAQAASLKKREGEDETNSTTTYYRVVVANTKPSSSSWESTPTGLKFFYAFTEPKAGASATYHSLHKNGEYKIEKGLRSGWESVAHFFAYESSLECMPLLVPCNLGMHQPATLEKPCDYNKSGSIDLCKNGLHVSLSGLPRFNILSSKWKDSEPGLTASIRLRGATNVELLSSKDLGFELSIHNGSEIKLKTGNKKITTVALNEEQKNALDDVKNYFTCMLAVPAAAAKPVRVYINDDLVVTSKYIGGGGAEQEQQYRKKVMDTKADHRLTFVKVGNEEVRVSDAALWPMVVNPEYASSFMGGDMKYAITDTELSKTMQDTVSDYDLTQIDEKALLTEGCPISIQGNVTVDPLRTRGLVIQNGGKVSISTGLKPEVPTDDTVSKFTILADIKLAASKQPKKPVNLVHFGDHHHKTQGRSSSSQDEAADDFSSVGCFRTAGAYAAKLSQELKSPVALSVKVKMPSKFAFESCHKQGGVILGSSTSGIPMRVATWGSKYKNGSVILTNQSTHASADGLSHVACDTVLFKGVHEWTVQIMADDDKSKAEDLSAAIGVVPVTHITDSLFKNKMNGNIGDKDFKGWGIMTGREWKKLEIGRSSSFRSRRTTLLRLRLDCERGTLRFFEERGTEIIKAKCKGITMPVRPAATIVRGDLEISGRFVSALNDNPPQPYAEWDFSNGTGKDMVGLGKNILDKKKSLDLSMAHGATIKDGVLKTGSNGGYAMTPNLDNVGKNRSYELLVKVVSSSSSSTEQRQGVMVLDQIFSENSTTGLTYSKNAAEGIAVHGANNTWTAYSNNRTIQIKAPPSLDESKDWIHIVVCFSSGGHIRCYRNGKSYGQPAKCKEQKFSSDSSRIIFGLCTFEDAGKKSAIGCDRDLEIKCARFFNKSLSQHEVEACYINVFQKYGLKIRDKKLIPFEVQDAFVDWVVTADGKPALMWKARGKKPIVKIFDEVDLRTGVWESIAFVHNPRGAAISLHHNGVKVQEVIHNGFRSNAEGGEEEEGVLGMVEMKEAWIGSDRQAGYKDCFKGMIKHLGIWREVPSKEDLLMISTGKPHAMMAHFFALNEEERKKGEKEDNKFVFKDPVGKTEAIKKKVGFNGTEGLVLQPSGKLSLFGIESGAKIALGTWVRIKISIDTKAGDVIVALDEKPYVSIRKGGLSPSQSQSLRLGKTITLMKGGAMFAPGEELYARRVQILRGAVKFLPLLKEYGKAADGADAYDMASAAVLKKLKSRLTGMGFPSHWVEQALRETGMRPIVTMRLLLENSSDFAEKDKQSDMIANAKALSSFGFDPRLCMKTIQAKSQQMKNATRSAVASEALKAIVRSNTSDGGEDTKYNVDEHKEEGKDVSAGKPQAIDITDIRILVKAAVKGLSNSAANPLAKLRSDETPDMLYNSIVATQPAKRQTVHIKIPKTFREVVEPGSEDFYLGATWTWRDKKGVEIGTLKLKKDFAASLQLKVAKSEQIGTWKLDRGVLILNISPFISNAKLVLSGDGQTIAGISAGEGSAKFVGRVEEDNRVGKAMETFEESRRELLASRIPTDHALEIMYSRRVIATFLVKLPSTEPLPISPKQLVELLRTLECAQLQGSLQSLKTVISDRMVAEWKNFAPRGGEAKHHSPQLQTSSVMLHKYAPLTEAVIHEALFQLMLLNARDDLSQDSSSSSSSSPNFAQVASGDTPSTGVLIWILQLFLDILNDGGSRMKVFKPLLFGPALINAILEAAVRVKGAAQLVLLKIFGTLLQGKQRNNLSYNMSRTVFLRELMMQLYEQQQEERNFTALFRSLLVINIELAKISRTAAEKKAAKLGKVYSPPKPTPNEEWFERVLIGGAAVETVSAPGITHKESDIFIRELWTTSTLHDMSQDAASSGDGEEGDATSFAWSKKKKATKIGIFKQGSVVQIKRAQGGCGHEIITANKGIKVGVLSIEFQVVTAGCHGACGVVLPNFKTFNNTNPDSQLGMADKTWAMSFYAGGHNPRSDRRLQFSQFGSFSRRKVKMVIDSNLGQVSFFVDGKKQGSHKGLPKGVELIPALSIGCSTNVLMAPKNAWKLTGMPPKKEKTKSEELMLMNLALAKRARQSSTSQLPSWAVDSHHHSGIQDIKHLIYSANNAVDGFSGNDKLTCSKTKEGGEGGHSSFWEVDLGKEYHLYDIRVSFFVEKEEEGKEDNKEEEKKKSAPPPLPPWYNILCSNKPFQSIDLAEAQKEAKYYASVKAIQGKKTVKEFIPKMIRVEGWAGAELDHLVFVSKTTRNKYGRQGGNAKPHFKLKKGEYITIVLHKTRNSYIGSGIKFTTSLGREILIAGSNFNSASTSNEYAAKPGYEIIGLNMSGSRCNGIVQVKMEEKEVQVDDLKVETIHVEGERKEDDYPREVKVAMAKQKSALLSSSSKSSKDGNNEKQFLRFDLQKAPTTRFVRIQLSKAKIPLVLNQVKVMGFAPKEDKLDQAKLPISPYKLLTCMFTKQADFVLVSLLNEYSEKNGLPDDLKFISELNQTVLTSNAHLTKYEYGSLSLMARYSMLIKFNKTVETIMPLVDMNAPKGYSSMAQNIRNSRSLILWAMKKQMWDRGLRDTMSKSRTNPSISLDQIGARKLFENRKTDHKGRISLFGQLYQQTKDKNVDNMWKIPPNQRAFVVAYVGFHTADAGGPYRDALDKICKEVESPALPLFMKSPNNKNKLGENRHAVVPRPSSKQPHHLGMFQFLGRLMGMAIRSRNLLPLNFTSVVWKPIINDHVGASDIEAIDKMCFKTFDKIKSIEKAKPSPELFDKQMEGIFFEISGSDGKKVELCRDGANKQLSWANRNEYMKLLLNFRINEFDVQVKAIRKGLAEVVPLQFTSLFTWKEIMIQVCGRGMTRGDCDLLERMTNYSGHQKTDQCIKNFWKMMRDVFNDEQRSQFIAFVWGRSRLPTSASDFSQRFYITGHSRSAGNPDGWFPIAHTCGFSIELPKYTTLDVMVKKITWAMQNCGSVDADGGISSGTRVEDNTLSDDEIDSFFE